MITDDRLCVFIYRSFLGSWSAFKRLSVQTYIQLHSKSVGEIRNWKSLDKKNDDIWSLRNKQLQSFCSVKIFLSFITPHCQVNMIFLYQALNCFPFKWSGLLYDITIFHYLSFLFIVVITCFIVFCLVDLFQIFVTIRISQSCFDETEKGWYVNEKLQGLDASLKPTWTIQIPSKSQGRTLN